MFSVFTENIENNKKILYREFSLILRYSLIQKVSEVHGKIIDELDRNPELFGMLAASRAGGHKTALVSPLVR